MINLNNDISEMISDSDSDYSGEEFELEKPNINRIITEKDIELIEKNNYLVVDSRDRDWGRNLMKTFDYYVKFNPEYNSDKFSVNKTIKNIKQIELLYCIIPNIVLNPIERHINNLDSTYPINNLQTIEDLPYILLELNDVDSVWNGTNDTINKSLAILVPDDCRDINANGYSDLKLVSDHEEISRKSIIYRNIEPNKKIYFPNLKNGMNLLKFKFFDPNGNQLNLHQDVLKISKICFEKKTLSGQPIVYKIKLIMNNFFSRLEYKESDNIIINNFKFGSISTSFKLKFLEKFINRKEGHSISYLSIYDELSNFNNDIGFKLTNCLVINFPIKMNDNDGKINTDFSYINSYATLPNSDDLYNITDCTGDLLNLYLQNSIHLKFTSIIGNISFKSKII